MVLGGLQDLVPGALLCVNRIPAWAAERAENNTEIQPILEKFTKQEPEEIVTPYKNCLIGEN